MATPEEVVRQSFEDFNNRTYPETSSDYVAEDVVLVDGPTEDEGQGVGELIGANDRWLNAFSDGLTEIISMEVDGNRVTTTFIGRGTFDGVMPMPDWARSRTTSR